MMIAWKYVNKRSATISALQDYKDMKSLLEIVPKQCSGEPSDIPDIYEDRLQKAKEYLIWFEPAWMLLSDLERDILKEYYMSNNLKSGAIIRLQYKLNYCERQIERLKSSALSRLSELLYG